MKDYCYQPSGVAPVKGIILALLIGPIAAIILSIIYIALQWFIPFIYINAIIAIALGIGIIKAVDLAIAWGKIRNVKFAVFIALFCGLLAYYSQWALYISLMSEAEGTIGKVWVKTSFHLDQYFAVFTHPKMVLNAMLYFNEIGTFTIKRTPVKGGFLWFIWVIEFIIIVVIPVIFAGFGKASKPFSELNNQWMIHKELPVKLGFIADKKEFVNKLIAGDLSILKAPAEAIDASADHAIIVLYESPGDDAKYLTVSNKTYKLDDKGNNKEDINEVITYFKINSAISF